MLPEKVEHTFAGEAVVQYVYSSSAPRLSLIYSSKRVKTEVRLENIRLDEAPGETLSEKLSDIFESFRELVEEAKELDE